MNRPRPHARAAARRLAACLALACILLGVQPARALDRKVDGAAKQALALALKDHLAGEDDGALLRLQKALRACGSSRCLPLTNAALFRDIGAIQFARGDHAKASISFASALDAAPDVEWNAAFDARETVAEWAAVKDERAAVGETPPSGDFDHTPESEQAIDTPLPIYAEGSVAGVAKVVVKYKVPGESDFRRMTLPRFGGGWGGTIPCHDVKRGLLRYFIQAFDAAGAPAGNSGDVRHLYFVPIRWTIAGAPPHLPGHAPPDACTGGGHVDDEEPAPVEPAVGAARDSRFVRWWFGVSGSFDITSLSSQTNACALSGGTPVASGFYCTTPGGADFPARAPNTGPSLVVGKGGDTPGGVVAGDVRILLTVDYAVTSNFLSGVRVGYVAQSYPGSAAANDGHGLSAPIHLELRETYIFGHDALAKSGFAPYTFASAGYAKFDASQLSSVSLVGVQGPEPVTVWKMGGPFFAALGVGARYALSPRVAFLTGVKAALPFGSGGVLPTISPEIELHYGF